MDILFPLGVLAGFAAAVITVLLMTAGVYQGNVERSANSFSGPTALAYLTEKLHQSDRADAVSIEQMDGVDALVFSVENQGIRYDTYLYCYEGMLRELMVNQELTASADLGRELLPLEGLELELVDDNLIRLRCTDDTSTTRESYVSLKSGEGAP